MCGNNEFHVFYTSEKYDSYLRCILKVADRQDSADEWRYVDFDPVKPEELGQYVKDLENGLLEQMAKCGVIAVTLERAGSS